MSLGINRCTSMDACKDNVTHMRISTNSVGPMLRLSWGLWTLINQNENKCKNCSHIFMNQGICMRWEGKEGAEVVSSTQKSSSNNRLMPQQLLIILHVSIPAVTNIPSISYACMHAISSHAYWVLTELNMHAPVLYVLFCWFFWRLHQMVFFSPPTPSVGLCACCK